MPLFLITVNTDDWIWKLDEKTKDSIPEERRARMQRQWIVFARSDSMYHQAFSTSCPEEHFELSRRIIIAIHHYRLLVPSSLHRTQSSDLAKHSHYRYEWNRPACNRETLPCTSNKEKTVAVKEMYGGNGGQPDVWLSISGLWIVVTRLIMIFTPLPTNTHRKSEKSNSLQQRV